MVAAYVVDVRGLDEGPDAWLLEMFEFVVVGCGEMRAHCAVVAGDHDTAFPCWCGGVDHVFDV